MQTSTLIKLTLVLVALIATPAWATTVWKWVDKNGSVHYSDQPAPGAVAVDLSAQTYSAEEANVPYTPRPSKAAVNAAYQDIQIVQPANGETLSGTGGEVSVTVQIQPALQGGDSVRLELDGNTVSEPDSPATTFQLFDVSRGAHTLVAQVVSPQGTTLLQSPSVTFYVQQTSLLQPNRQKPVPPPPKKKP
jgi:Domain of unknown function (DUF4124)